MLMNVARGDMYLEGLMAEYRELAAYKSGPHERHFLFRATGNMPRDALSHEDKVHIVLSAISHANSEAKKLPWIIPGKYLIDIPGVEITGDDEFCVHLVLLGEDAKVPPCHPMYTKNVHLEETGRTREGSIFYSLNQITEFTPDYSLKQFLMKPNAAAKDDRARANIIIEADDIAQVRSKDFDEYLRKYKRMGDVEISAENNYRIMFYGPYWKGYVDTAQISCYHPKYHIGRPFVIPSQII